MTINDDVKEVADAASSMRGIDADNAKEIVKEAAFDLGIHLDNSQVQEAVADILNRNRAA